MSKKFRWENLTKDVQRFVQTCAICARNKDSHSRPAGQLQIMPVPTIPWQTISLVFITKMPIVQGFNTILVVVDFLTKMGHFIPLKGIPSAKGLAKTFIDNIVRLHGLPSIIISNRGPQFIAKFWRNLCATLDVEVRLSSSYHPQTDGQTECTNQSLEQYLRCLLSTLSSDWTECLSIAEFAYNNHTHSSTGFSPFYCSIGIHPKSLPLNLDPIIDSTS